MDACAVKALPLDAIRRARLRIAGRVHEVGFRPFIAVLAKRLWLSGWVRNDGETVVVEVEGAEVPRFIYEVERFAPPLARIDAVDCTFSEPLGEAGFVVLSDPPGGRAAP